MKKVWLCELANIPSSVKLRFFAQQPRRDAPISMKFDREEHIMAYSLAYQLPS